MVLHDLSNSNSGTFSVLPTIKKKVKVFGENTLPY